MQLRDNVRVLQDVSEAVLEKDAEHVKDPDAEQVKAKDADHVQDADEAQVVVRELVVRSLVSKPVSPDPSIPVPRSGPGWCRHTCGVRAASTPGTRLCGNVGGPASPV